MKENDIKQLLTVLKLNYPAAYRDMSIEERKALVALWLDAFGGLDVEVVGHALKNYIKANKYPPTIAGLQEQIDLLIGTDNTEQLWQQLMKAVRNSGRDAKAEFEAMPPECRAFVGSPAELRTLGNTDLSTVNTVTRGQFYSRIKHIKEQRRVQEQLPANVRDKLQGALRLEEQDEIQSRGQSEDQRAWNQI